MARYIISRQIRVDLELAPSEIAEAFCSLSAHDQAVFFNNIGRITETWDGAFAMQLQYITDEEVLMDKGRRVMGLIGEYSEKS